MILFFFLSLTIQLTSLHLAARISLNVCFLFLVKCCFCPGAWFNDHTCGSSLQQICKYCNVTFMTVSLLLYMYVVLELLSSLKQIFIFDCHVQDRVTRLVHWTQVQDLALAGCCQLLGLTKFLELQNRPFYTVVCSGSEFSQ